MVDSKIIKGLECCAADKYLCNTCPYNHGEQCADGLLNDALDLIKLLAEERDAAIAAQETLQKYINKLQEPNRDKNRKENT